MKEIKFLLLILAVFHINACVVVEAEDEEELPQMLTMSAKVDQVSVKKTCENDGNSGKADIYIKFMFHKNDTPKGSSWGIFAESEEVVLELGKGETVNDPNIVLSKDLVPFDSMRVEFILTAREVDRGPVNQIRKSGWFFMRYDAKQLCWVEESNTGKIGTDCLEGSLPGSSAYSKTIETRLLDKTCDVTIKWTLNIEHT